MAAHYRITGVVGDPKAGRGEKRVLIATANSRKEAVHVAKRKSKEFARVRIEPVSAGRQKNDPMNRLDRDAQGRKAAERRMRKRMKNQVYKK